MTPQLLLACWLVLLCVNGIHEQFKISINDSCGILAARIVGILGQYFVIVHLTYRGGFWTVP